MKKMPEYLKRMIIEENDLCEKIKKLDKFLMSDAALKLEYGYYHLMVSQLETMQAYRRILHVRIHYEMKRGDYA